MNRQHPNDRRRHWLVFLTAALLAVAAVEASLDRTDPTAVRAPVSGDFTGEIAPGGPVYRLPPVHVVADRKTELARIEREDRFDRARETLAKTGLQPDS